eukprot:1160546-Pelagomonas_calceolata.AAC.8
MQIKGYPPKGAWLRKQGTHNSSLEITGSIIRERPPQLTHHYSHVAVFQIHHSHEIQMPYPHIKVGAGKKEQGLHEGIHAAKCLSSNTTLKDPYTTSSIKNCIWKGWQPLPNVPARLKKALTYT